MSQGVIIMIRKYAEFCWTRVFSRGSLSLQKLMVAVLLLMSVNSAMAAVLEDISYAVLPGSRVEIRLSMTEAVGVSSEFTTNNPARISMDFVGLSSALTKKNTRIDSGEVIGVTAVEVQGKMRVVIALLEMDSYTTRQEGSDFVITIGSEAGMSSNYQEPTPMTNSYSSSTGNSISGLDFRRGNGGEGQIILDLSSTDVSVDLRQEGRKVIADFLDTGMTDTLLRKLDVIDFATPASYIQTVRMGNNIRLTIDTENDFEYLAYQTDNTFTIELKPLTENEAKKLR
ncbi:MAG: type IV pilus assembly protein PilQ, partial [Enterobacterales bacterium]